MSQFKLHFKKTEGMGICSKCSHFQVQLAASGRQYTRCGAYGRAVPEPLEYCSVFRGKNLFDGYPEFLASDALYRVRDYNKKGLPWVWQDAADRQIYPEPKEEAGFKNGKKKKLPPEATTDTPKELEEKEEKKDDADV